MPGRRLGAEASRARPHAVSARARGGAPQAPVGRPSPGLPLQGGRALVGFGEGGEGAGRGGGEGPAMAAARAGARPQRAASSRVMFI